MRKSSTRSGPIVRAVAVAVLLVSMAGAASAQMIFDGNIMYENRVAIAGETINDQFISVTAATAACPGGYSALVLGTSTYTHNSYADPLLPDAPYKTNVVPVFKPLVGSPAFTTAPVLVPNDGFFKQVCFKGAMDQNDWTQGWTYWDSTGANRSDIHLSTMPNPRPTATYMNVDIISAHQYFSPDSNYYIVGQLRILQGASLTIAPGVVILEDEPSFATIIVRRGGKIHAVGTKCDPIIITSNVTPGLNRSGQCGGLYLLGRGKMNPTNTCAGDSVAAEGGTMGHFGGNDDSDGSGELRYVRVEYAGKERSANNELNSFTFCGVGDRTKGEYLQAFEGDDDGFEWFGGKMDSRYLIAVDGKDDGYDTQLGARTRSQFVIVRNSPKRSISTTQFGDKAIEADNTETSPFNQTVCAGRSFIQISNATLVGDQRLDDGTLYPGPLFGAHWRRGTSYTLLNSIITNYKTGALGIEHDATWDAHCAAIPADGTLFSCPLSVGTRVDSGSLFVASSPNPFRNQMNFAFTLPKAGPVSVEIYSADGRHVATVAEGEMQAGQNRVTWNIDKNTPAGMYFYRVVAGGSASTGKIARVK